MPEFASMLRDASSAAVEACDNDMRPGGVRGGDQAQGGGTSEQQMGIENAHQELDRQLILKRGTFGDKYAVLLVCVCMWCVCVCVCVCARVRACVQRMGWRGSAKGQVPAVRDNVHTHGCVCVFDGT